MIPLTRFTAAALSVALSSRLHAVNQAKAYSSVDQTATNKSLQQGEMFS